MPRMTTNIHILGATASTKTLKVHVLMRAAWSTAVQLTVLVPAGKTVLFDGEHEMVL
jgi:hypothetical protein